MAVLEISGLEKQSEDAIVFPAFTLEVSEGQSVAICSSINVRSVLLKMMTGKIAISSGEISVNQEKLSLHKGAYHPQIGISFLDEGMYERLSANDHFKLYKRLYDSNQPINDLLYLVQLESKRHKKVNTLSYSEKRRIQMARLIFQNPRVFVFEEPDQNVDVETKHIFLRLVRELQKSSKSVLILTANMESAVTLADQVYRLNENGLHAIEIKAGEIEPEADSINDRQLREQELIQPVKFDKIPTKVNEKIVLFDPLEIDYIESIEGQSNIHSGAESFLCIFTLNELEARLQPYGFFRCHRSYIVNLQKVREVITWTRNSYSLILEDKAKSEIPLSKTKMAELKDMLGLK